MADHKDILTLEEFIGFLYGMVVANHDIETVFIDGVLKQADINLDSLPHFIQKLQNISMENNIEFFISVRSEITMKKIKIEFTNERIIPASGLAVVGAILGKVIL